MKVEQYRDARILKMNKWVDNNHYTCNLQILLHVHVWINANKYMMMN